MAFIVTAKPSVVFEEPPLGLQPAVCAFVEDLGWEMNMKDELQQKCVLLFETKALMKDGRPFMVSKMYSVSLHEKSSLRHDLESWRGKVFTQEELDGFDLDKLRGAPCMLNLVESVRRGGEKGTKISSIMAMPRPAPGEAPRPRMVPVNTQPPEWVSERRKKNAPNTPKPDTMTHDDEPVVIFDDNGPPF